MLSPLARLVLRPLSAPVSSPYAAGELQAARLAVCPAAVLGRALPHHVRGGRARGACLRARGPAACGAARHRQLQAHRRRLASPCRHHRLGTLLEGV
eukprot:4400759-Pyramimonas_sp.AAC.1